MLSKYLSRTYAPILIYLTVVANLSLSSADLYMLKFKIEFKEQVAKPYQQALNALSNRVIKLVSDEMLPSLLLNDSVAPQSLLTNVDNGISEALQQANKSCNWCEILSRDLKQKEESYIKEINDAQQMLEVIEIKINQLDQGINTPEVQQELSLMEQQYSEALRVQEDAYTVFVNLREELAEVTNCIYRPKRQTIAIWDPKKALKQLAAKIINYPCHLFNGSGIRETEENHKAARHKFEIASQKVLKSHVRNHLLVQQRNSLIYEKTRTTETQSRLKISLKSSRDSVIVVANFSGQLESIMERLSHLKITDTLSHNSVSKLGVNMGHLLPSLKKAAELAVMFSGYFDLSDSYELSLRRLTQNFDVLKEKIANYPNI